MKKNWAIACVLISLITAVTVICSIFFFTHKHKDLYPQEAQRTYTTLE